MNIRIKTFLLISLFGIMMVSCNQQGDKKSDDQQPVSEIDDLSMMITEDSTDAGLFEQRAIAYLNEKNHNMAMRDMLYAIQLDPDNAAYMLTLSDIYLSMGLMENCMESLDRALELDPDNVESMLKLAEINLIMRKHKEALEYAEMAIEADKSNPLPYFIKGFTYEEAGDTVGAIKNYLEAIDKNQSYYDAYVQLGLIYSTANNPLAIDYFNNALKLDPQSVEALYALGLFYQQIEDVENAITIYKRLLVVDPQNAYCHYNLGYVNLVFLKNFEEAVIHFDRAAQLKPDYFEALFNKGYCYELLGEIEKARELYKEVLKIQVNYPRAVEGLNRIQGK